MDFKLQRVRMRNNRTNGQLYVNDEFFCFTLEDLVRNKKIPGETAIPAGIYRLTLVTSPKFGPDTISVNNVPGFGFIRIHSGNTEKDTEGCILVGYKLVTDSGVIIPGTTRPALNDLKKIVKRGLVEDKDGVRLRIFDIVK